MTPAEFAKTPLGKRRVGLRYVLTADDDPHFREPVSRVFDLSIAELRRMVEVIDDLDDLPAGFGVSIQAVARKR